MHSKKKSLFAYGLLILFVYSGTRIAVTLSKSGLPTKDSELTTLEPASQKNEWLLNTEYGVRVWVAGNLTSVRARTIYLFLEAKDFSEKNLKKVFLGFAEKYREPNTLTIRCFTDESVIRKHLRDEESTAVSTNAESGRGVCFSAAYYRVNGSENMVYSTGANKDDYVNLTIKSQDVDYSGDIDKDLLLAVDAGEIARVKNLLRRGANANTLNKDGDNPLMRAVLNGHTEIANELLLGTKDIGHSNDAGWTALMYAAAEGETDIVKRLLEIGASVDARNKNGYTPLMLAATRGSLAVTKVLLQHGADANSKDDEGRTIIALVDTALSGEVREKILLLLKRAGASR